MARLHRISVEVFVMRAVALHMADGQVRLADPAVAAWVAANTDLAPERLG